MFNLRLGFDSPYYLLLLAALPLVWLHGFRSLSSIGRWRRWFAIGLRTVLVVMFTLALAETQIVQTTDRVCVIYALDRSLSVAPEKLAAAGRYVGAATDRHRQRATADEAGLIVFGRTAAVETPPLDGAIGPIRQIETAVDAEASNLADALKLAKAVFPADAAKRVVLISDGNQNLGDVLTESRALTEQGIGIDVLPLTHAPRTEVAVEKVTAPAAARQGVPFEVRVVLAARIPPGGPATVTGNLHVLRAASGRSELLADQPVELKAGKHVLTFRDALAATDFYTYQARFVPADARYDATPQNNEATAFTHIRGRGRVLFIEDAHKAGQFDALAARLRDADIDLTMQTTNTLFSGLAELQPFDAVVLADVPLYRKENPQQDPLISDSQIDALVRNTQQMGAGLVMLGGADSFGAGGWNATPLEEAMPLDFHIKNLKVMPVAALMLVIDSSGSMQGEKLRMSKAAALAAIKVLSPRDFVGVTAFDSFAHVITPLQPVRDPESYRRGVEQLESGGGTNLEPAIKQAYRALTNVSAGVKHVIVLTDGQTEGDDYPQLAAEMRKMNITTTCLAIGNDAAVGLLSRTAGGGGGKFYKVDNPLAIPRVFVKEALRVTRPVIHEDPKGISVQGSPGREILSGLPRQFPPVTGFVLTTPKNSPLVEISLQAPPTAGQTNAILATWQYGLGRTAAFTTDAGHRWASQWVDWDGYGKLFVQMVRWSMRPSDDNGTYTVDTDVCDGRVRIVVASLDDDRDLGAVELFGAVAGPESFTADVTLKQTAPGRYIGEFPTDRAGSYFVSISPGKNRAPIRTGVNVPYSAEFKEQSANEPLLRRLVENTPAGGQPGAMIAEPTGVAGLEASLQTNVFRRDLVQPTSRAGAWHWLVFWASCLFFCDVFNRRVTLNFEWVRPAASQLYATLSQRAMEAAPTAPLARLKARKDEVGRELASRQASTHLAPESEPTAGLTSPQVVESPTVKPMEGAATNRPTAPQADQDYLGRLLRAKQKLRDQGE